MTSPPYTTVSLAKRWGCTPQHVRKMIRSGQLKAIRLGDKLIRIPATVVEEYEECSQGLDDTRDDGTRSGQSRGSISSASGDPKRGGPHSVPRIVPRPSATSPTS
ncbi:MAG: helix-turn-helix domain-containing protein [Hyphomicrobiaceae bacterium]